uniref:Ternary complex factor MIP1 leucine-zipper domain-containing protein n=1 Tax=Musa acuminata subsp. malaccensis TaxID=214687 RepID=A0A804JV71_MUSAM
MTNTRVRTALQAMKAPGKHNKETKTEETAEMQGNKSSGAKEGSNKRQSRREKKIALQHDVDKLRKKLRHEENVHRALERAFTRPLGSLPRLPPYLPSHTVELLAEVAVLEEEVVRLEEQLVNFRQGLYQEAVLISSSKKTKEIVPDTDSDGGCSQKLSGPSSNQSANGKRRLNKQNTSLNSSEDRRGKENQWITNFSRNQKQSPVKKVLKTQVTVFQKYFVSLMYMLIIISSFIQAECVVKDRNTDEMILWDASDEASLDKSTVPNKLSEDILKCLMNIFLRIKRDSQDPYGICAEFGKRDIGPYKHFRSVEVISKSQNFLMASSSLKCRLKVLLRKLESVDISELTHQQKLAFWINIYNSCMMNAYLEQGIPKNPEMIAAMMPKAVINVGGHLLSAMTIEHFILRLPCHMKNLSPKGLKSDTMIIRGIFGMEWPEPLVTFALSCGSWSSPAVRVYTAAQVEEELETAKRDYLQATIGILKPNKLVIPKLLDWYLLDFAKDVESLMAWVCLQLPSELRTEAVKCLELGRRSVIPQTIQFLTYEFKFRYLLAPHTTLSPTS